MKSYGVDEYVCYATTAVREASNSEYIIDQINIRTGIKVTIISNEEERFLHNKAFALNNSYFDDIIEAGAVLVDVASGSVQAVSYTHLDVYKRQGVHRYVRVYFQKKCKGKPYIKDRLAFCFY